MKKLDGDRQSSRVTAVFADRALCFTLSKDATLAELTERLAFMGAGMPVAVNVRLAS
jgi:hypothetical protein